MNSRSARIDIAPSCSRTDSVAAGRSVPVHERRLPVLKRQLPEVEREPAHEAVEDERRHVLGDVSRRCHDSEPDDRPQSDRCAYAYPVHALIIDQNPLLPQRPNGQPSTNLADPSIDRMLCCPAQMESKATGLDVVRA